MSDELVNLGNIARGAALEAFQHEFALVLRNITDPSTPATAKRSITLKVEFEPESDRVKVATKFSCTSRLADSMERAGEIYIVPGESGGIVALNDNPQQPGLWDANK